jgi:HSP20 family protein
MNSLEKRSNGHTSMLPQWSTLLEDVFGKDIIGNGFNNHGGQSNLPSVNIKETDEAYELEMAVPGMVKEDFKIELNNSSLMISSHKEKKDEEKDEQGRYTRKEFSYRSFTRTFKLPEGMVEGDKIAAKYENGILFITVPKTEQAKPKPVRKIEIS